MADLIDPTQTGNYPVILGDGLLGKTSNDIFTGVRCKSFNASSLLVLSRPLLLTPPRLQTTINPHNQTPKQVVRPVSNLLSMARPAHTTC